jgi:hypothetical protein
MKRSEALEEMRKILAMNGKDDDYGELEEAILHHLENIGMLPPPSSFNVHNVDKQLGFVAEVTYDFPINKDNSVNLWEPEDET